MMNLFGLIGGGTKALAALAADGDIDLEAVGEVAPSITPAWVDVTGLTDLLSRFFINLFFIGIIVRVFYYPKCKRNDYFFTFLLIAISVFLLIFLMGGVKLKVGFALGLFAIFGIIRYRTEAVQIREMTYLFIIIAVSAINGLATSISWAELGITNLLFIFALWICESDLIIKHTSHKTILYDNISLITPDKENELIEDLKKRTGLNILKVEVGGIDFLKDSAIIKIQYKSNNRYTSSVDDIYKKPKDEFKINN